MYNTENLIVYMIIWVVLLVVFLVLGGKLLFDKCKGRKVAKGRVVAAIVILVLFVIANIFMFTHKIYYRYCDSWIMGKSLDQVKERYGEFDYLWESKELGGGEAGYFLYFDNGFLPDYQDHYLMMEYDKDGVVTRVFDGTQSN